MSHTAANPLTEALRREEKSFLIQHYARLLLEEVEQNGHLDARIIESLLVARLYADTDMALRIANLLAAHGHYAPLGTTNAALLADEATPSPVDLDADEEESGSLYGQEKTANLFADDDAFCENDDAIQEAENLFAEDEESFLAGEEGDGEDLAEDYGDEERDELFAGAEDTLALDAAGLEDDLFPYDAEEGEKEEEAAEEKKDDEETLGFAPTKCSEEDETAGFDAPEVIEKESQVSLHKKVAPTQSQKGMNRSAEAQRKATEGGEDIGQKPKPISQEEEHSAADLLGNITYQVSLDDIEKRLGMRAIPEDRMRLDRQLAQKIHEPSIRAMLQGAGQEGVTLAMVPRLPRFISEGQLFQVTGANLMRGYPQFFENVQQVVLEMRSEAFFLQESPELGWAIVTTEILDASRDKTYMQQNQALKAHAQRYQATERRVRRRLMIDALYDLIIIKLVHDVNMLSETVDLTESKIGQQNRALVNYGKNGIRISDIGRRQTHPQLGICPNW